MGTSKLKDTALKFVAAINAADVDQIVDFMSDDHVFVDSGGAEYHGKEAMRQGWIGYFGMFPDYKIEAVAITESGSTVGIFGYASGTYKSLKNESKTNFYRVPAAWKAVIEKGKIKHWQVYCETDTIVEIIENNK